MNNDPLDKKNNTKSQLPKKPKVKLAKRLQENIKRRKVISEKE